MSDRVPSTLQLQERIEQAFEYAGGWCMDDGDDREAAAKAALEVVAPYLKAIEVDVTVDEDSVTWYRARCYGKSGQWMRSLNRAVGNVLSALGEACSAGNMPGIPVVEMFHVVRHPDLPK